MNFNRVLVASLLLISVLSACGLKSVFDISPRHSGKNELCNRLKRDIVFYTYEHNNDTSWSSPASRAQILREYKENNCEALLSGTADSKGPHTESTPFSLPGNAKGNQNNVQIRQQ
jgi:hypothetical protein